ncbi:MAG: YebC/PmpR family DNA-binding transcriptional regulator [Actinomycetota bacterium]
MSGHSKWAQIKHKKGREDAKRGRIFSRLSRAIMVAAKEGGGNPDLNPALATAIQKARDYNMPHENIERAIKRGTGELGEARFEHIIYEGYGPNGVAIIVHVLTDNRNRAAADIRSIFSRHQGNLGATGCVSWMFDKKGHILINKEEGIDEDELLTIAIEAGAEDMRAQNDHYEIITSPTDLMSMRKTLEEHGITPDSAEITMLPKSTVKLHKEEAKRVLRLMDALEEHDDVQEIYANFDIPDEILEELTIGVK